MTVPIPPGPTPAGPPFGLDVLADLHAGVYPEQVAARLHDRVAADPAASAAMAALDATVAALRDLPPIPIPAEVAARLDGIIAAESAARAGGDGARRTPTAADHPGAPDLAGRATPLRPRDDRRRRYGSWSVGLGIAAAVAAVFTIGAVLLHPAGTAGSGTAGGEPGLTTAAGPAGRTGGATSAPVPLQQAVVAQPHHLGELLSRIEGSVPGGPFGDPARLAACLAANGVSGQQVLGVLPVNYTGRLAYAISVHAAGDTVRILVVGPGCGAAGADLMEQQTAAG